MLFSCVPYDITCGEESIAVASHLYRVYRWNSNPPSENEGSSCMCPGFRASLLFTQRNFFSRLGSACWTLLLLPQMLLDCYWSGSCPLVADLKSWGLQRKTVKVTHERWYGADSVASSAVGEVAPRTPECISDVFELGDVQYVNEHHKVGRGCCSRSVSRPGKCKQRWVPVSPVESTKQFSVANPFACRPSIQNDLRKVLRCQEREELTMIGLMPQFCKGVINIDLTVQNVIDFSHSLFVVVRN